MLNNPVLNPVANIAMYSVTLQRKGVEIPHICHFFPPLIHYHVYMVGILYLRNLSQKEPEMARFELRTFELQSRRSAI